MRPRLKVKSALGDRITRDQRICGGQEVIKGTRVTLRTLLASLADGDSVEEILEAFPSLTLDDMRAVIAFAAASAVKALPVPRIPQAVFSRGRSRVGRRSSR
jgi:uncharacterized protein (DUF433 family)